MYTCEDELNFKHYFLFIKGLCSLLGYVSDWDRLYTVVWPISSCDFSLLTVSKQHLMSKLYDFNKALRECYPFPYSPAG